MENPDPRTNTYAKNAANPNMMGSFGQPTGRPMKPNEGRDMNHPSPSGHIGAGSLPAASRSQPGTPGERGSVD